jgi:hypothetical protein
MTGDFATDPNKKECLKETLTERIEEEILHIKTITKDALISFYLFVEYHL